MSTPPLPVLPRLVLPVENRLLITEEDRLDPDEIDGVRGNDLDENLFNPVVKLFLKLFGGGLGASLGVFKDSLSMPTLPFAPFALTGLRSLSDVDLSCCDDGDDTRLTDTQFSLESSSPSLKTLMTSPCSRRW